MKCFSIILVIKKCGLLYSPWETSAERSPYNLVYWSLKKKDLDKNKILYYDLFLDIGAYQ